MSTRVTEDGLKIVHKGRGDHRVFKGDVGARTEPRFEHGDVSLWRMDAGQRFTLFLSTDDFFDLLDAMEELADYIEEHEDEDQG